MLKIKVGDIVYVNKKNHTLFKVLSKDFVGSNIYSNLLCIKTTGKEIPKGYRTAEYDKNLRLVSTNYISQIPKNSPKV